MEKETEFKQPLLQRVDKICRYGDAIVVCSLLICCAHVYIFGSDFTRILPIAVSAAICIGGMQGVFYSL